MYNPPTFMTMEVLSEVLSEFQWPAAYILEDELPDGIAMEFPNCRLLFSEGFESDMRLIFPASHTGMKPSLDLTDALIAIRSDPKYAANVIRLNAAKLRPDHISASLDKVTDGIRDLCILLLAALPECILGDFRWVESYKAYQARAEKP